MESRGYWRVDHGRRSDRGFNLGITSGELHGFLVRKAEKQHGTGQSIEGFRKKAARVVIVDDVCTTGSIDSPGD